MTTQIRRDAPTQPPTPAERQAALASGSPLFMRSDPQLAFERAVSAGRLSHDAKSPIFAGRFMYMGSTMGTHRDLFKHIDTKLYLRDEDTEQWAEGLALPITLMGACQQLHRELPVSHDDLVDLIDAIEAAGIQTNMSKDFPALRVAP